VKSPAGSAGAGIALAPGRDPKGAMTYHGKLQRQEGTVAITWTRRRLPVLAAVVWFLAGCGGSGSNSQDVEAGANDATSSSDGSGSGSSSGAGSSGSGSGSGTISGSSSSDGGDSGPPPPSCAPGGPGLTNCGASSESCCTSLEVPGGTYYRTYDLPLGADDGGLPVVPLAADGGPSNEGDPATVSGFRLDKYEATVGRFRQFVAAWHNGSGWLPPAGSGKHTHLNGGPGLANSGSAGTYEPGWVASDDSKIAPTNVNLACDATYFTWTASAGSNENLPINCLNWYEAYAFCIWDGGFLPSEAEWEYAAAGGSLQREFPWGSTDPGTGHQYAIYGCYYPSGTGNCNIPPVTGVTNIAPVGAATQGAGLWGQLDLAGDMWEWNLDYWDGVSPYVDPCTDCANLTAASYRVIRGGDFSSAAPVLIPPARDGDTPTDRMGSGLRCARTP
jgi:sulfatase modifying factor 1